MGKQGDLSQYQHRLTPDQAQRQQMARRDLLKLYPDVAPSSYAPVVETERETTYRFFVRKGDVLTDAATLVEVSVKKARK